MEKIFDIDTKMSAMTLKILLTGLLIGIISVFVQQANPFVGHVIFRLAESIMFAPVVIEAFIFVIVGFDKILNG